MLDFGYQKINSN